MAMANTLALSTRLLVFLPSAYLVNTAMLDPWRNNITVLTPTGKFEERLHLQQVTKKSTSARAESTCLYLLPFRNEVIRGGASFHAYVKSWLKLFQLRWFVAQLAPPGASKSLPALQLPSKKLLECLEILGLFWRWVGHKNLLRDMQHVTCKYHAHTHTKLHT